MTRARDLGVPFAGVPGSLNAITDVGGVEVGYATLISGEGPLRVGHHTVGAFVQANFGSRRELTVAGVSLGLRLLADNPQETSGWLAPPGAGSVIVIIATDAPLLPGQCKALARRSDWRGPGRPARTSPATSSWRSLPPTAARCQGR